MRPNTHTVNGCEIPLAYNSVAEYLSDLNAEVTRLQLHEPWEACRSKVLELQEEIKRIESAPAPVRDLYNELRWLGSMTFDQCCDVMDWLKTLPVRIEGVEGIQVTVDETGITVKKA